MTPEIVWLRRDLRLADNPALSEAAANAHGVVPVFVYGEHEATLAEEGAASHWWLHHSLVQLQKAFEAIGSKLIILQGDPTVVIPKLAAELGAKHIRVNRRYEPKGIETDTAIQEKLAAIGIAWSEHSGNVLHEPEDVVTKDGDPYRVFTPWWRASQKRNVPKPQPKVKRLPTPTHWPASATISDLKLLPQIDWASGLEETWNPGENGAQEALAHAIQAVILRYNSARDFPADPNGTSHLSPHLHFGEISPRHIWHQVQEAIPSGSEPFRRQLGWRDFAHTTLAANPQTVTDNLNTRFDAFPWRTAPEDLKRWQRGMTGYPYIDAGMRELWHTGWMHNRVRMAVASFLVKHLLIHWRHGADWFADTLVDADLPNNIFGWQWSAGCGADAAPYFRIFNPILQGKKFDSKGAYVRKWVPELASVPDTYIHCPWDMPELELAAAKVYLGQTYPRPIVEHKFARERALEALKATKDS